MRRRLCAARTRMCADRHRGARTHIGGCPPAGARVRLKRWAKLDAVEAAWCGYVRCGGRGGAGGLCSPREQRRRSPGSIPVGASWQTNGRVETVVVSGSTAYLGGDFTSVRPSGDPAGTGEVARNHAAAINLETGRAPALGSEREQHRAGHRRERSDGLPRRDVRHRRRQDARPRRGRRCDHRRPDPDVQGEDERRGHVDRGRPERPLPGRELHAPPTTSPTATWPRSTPRPARS